MKFIPSCLHVLLMECGLILRALNVRIELSVSSAIHMIDKDDLSEVVEFFSYTHMINQSVTPIWEFCLGKPQTRSCEDKLIIVYVITLARHKVQLILQKTKVHASD